MPTLPIYQVDAFADRPFTGNPAAVVPLEAWLPDEVLQAIAMENNLSETAYLVGADGRYDLRWFTPAVEVDLCGHATLASCHVVFSHLGFSGDLIRFQTRSGELTVRREGRLLAMDFPAADPTPVATPAGLAEALGAKVEACLSGRMLMACLSSAESVLAVQPDFPALARLLTAHGYFSCIVTASYLGSEDWDFVSRMFAPTKGIDEDPVTGSAHCDLVPYWAAKLHKSDLVARQASRRGGTLWCTLAGDRVVMRGRAVDFLKGEISV